MIAENVSVQHSSDHVRRSQPEHGDFAAAEIRRQFTVMI
jgi:hypothetical protein